MKKTILLAILLGAGLPLFAQSTLSFANTSTTLMRTNDNLGNSGPITFAANTVTFELLVGPAGATTTDSLTVIGSVGNSSTAGRIFGGTRTNASVGPGAVFSAQVRGYFQGASYDTAGWQGISSIIQVDGGDPTAVPPGTPTAIFGTTAGLINGLTLTPIPEPSSIALGLLGLGAIALFRRRK